MSSEHVSFDCLCTETHCLLKTGMSSGPNYLKSFYICPQNCGFVKKSRHAECSVLFYCYFEEVF